MIGPIYFVTDADAPHSILDQARAAANGGANAVQLRDKVLSDREFHDLAVMLMTELKPSGVKVIVNDRVHVAQSSKAHGVHVGQSDGHAEEARERLGPLAIIGLSIENLAQCADVPGCVDYIGAGPVRATATKPDHAPPIGFEGLAEIAAASAVPTIAIGGLGFGDAAAIKQAGCAGLAVVSAISRADDPQTAARALLNDWNTA
ncbi:MAG: thiamine phosphate synthase [Pseudomonadota bacterium]